MSRDVRVVDPGDVDPTEPVPGLVERPIFHVGGRRFVLLRIDGESPTYSRSGTVYGWVRAGRGRVAFDGGRADLEAGDFLRVPAGAVRGYAADRGGMELLAVVDGGDGVTAADASAPVGGDAEPEVVGSDGLVPTVESPGLTRETPFPDAAVLVMRVRAAGGAAAGWHHHGDNVYFGYAVDGPSETEYGPSGDEVARIGVGECFHVPPGLVHRDTNPTDDPHTGIVWLCGGDPWVVNVDSPA